MNNYLDIKYNSLYYYFIVHFYVDNDYKLVKAELQLASKDYLAFNKDTNSKILPENAIDEDLLSGFLNFKSFQDAYDCEQLIHNKMTFSEVKEKYFTKV